MRKTWSILKTIINKKRSNRIQTEFKNGDSIINDKSTIAEKFNDHFSTVAEKLHGSLPQNPIHTPAEYMKTPAISQSFYFSPTDPLEIQNVIRKLRSKNSCSLDGITTKMIKCFPIKLNTKMHF